MAPTTLVHPLLGPFLELIHESSVDAGSVFALIATRRDAFELALRPVPECYAHPADPLIGFVVPHEWDAIVLLASGRLHDLDGERDLSANSGGSVRVSTLLDRHGASISVIDGAAGPRRLDDVPIGWVPDAMARALGLATPAPEESTAAWLEALWLDRLAPAIFGPHPEAISWEWLVARHPLAGDASHPSPSSLAARTFTYALDTPWSALRRRTAPSLEDLHGPVHPMGHELAVEPAEWFDDGAYARWVMRRMPPLGALLADLLTVIDEDLGEALLDALVSVRPWS